VTVTNGNEITIENGDEAVCTITNTFESAPALTLTKTARLGDGNSNGTADAGEVITYNVTVRNTGNVTITDLVVTDSFEGGAATTLSCTPTTLAPDQEARCAAYTHTVTQAEVDEGETLDNTATANGTPPPGAPQLPPASDNTNTPVTGAGPAMSLTKVANPRSFSAVGDVIEYEYTLANIGGVVINDLSVTDDKLGTISNCAPSSIAPSESSTCTATYTVVQADLDAGSITNNAIGNGSPESGMLTPPEDSETVVASSAPALTLEKTADDPIDGNGNGITDVGDTIAYSFTVTNSGNVALERITVTDTKLSDDPIACNPSDLEPGRQAICGPVTYTITEDDVAAGSVENSATASGTPPGSTTPVESPPSRTNTPTAPPEPALSTSKQQTANDDADGSSDVSVGDTLTYTVTVTNTGNVPLLNVVIEDEKLTPSSQTCARVEVDGTCVLTGTYTVRQADADAGEVVNTATVTTDPPPGGSLPPEACPAGSGAAQCRPSTRTPIVQRPAITTTKTATLTVDNGTPDVGNPDDVITYQVTAQNTGNVTLVDVAVVDTMEGGQPRTLTCAPTTLAPNETATCQAYTHTITQAEASRGGTLNNTVDTSGRTPAGGTPSRTVRANDNATVEVAADPALVRIVKTVQPRTVRIGDLVRYQLTLENIGQNDVVDATLVDRPPAGFTLVADTLEVVDRDRVSRLVNPYPIMVDQIDIAVGDRATVTYLLRVGAGVRGGVHTNTAVLNKTGTPISNTSTASVQLVGDPTLDESLILGTVFDDRDEDGWQDSAAMSGVHVQGGFAPGAYVANSTTVDRGAGAQPQADASSPLLHGIAIGNISARQSDADPVQAHQVVVSQRLNALDFTNDFVLTSQQGVSVRMDAAGKTTVEHSGDAAKGLTAAAPTVERKVAQVQDGYQVDYVIQNQGVYERGIPGVRIASVEGLLMETDQFGRYHVIGIDGGRWERGRNFILKVDPATVPPGSAFTTDNPLLRRITPGLPVRFDFGVKLPPGLVEGRREEVEMVLGEVLFEPESAQVRPQYLGTVDAIAQQVRERGAGEVVISANGESEALAYDRAKAVREALLAKLTPEQAAGVTVSLRGDLQDPSSTLLSLGESPVLGTVLFDTDKSIIKPEFVPIIDKVAADIAALAEKAKGDLIIGVVGKADARGSDDYNVRLGMRRARAVYDAVAAKLMPPVRARVRVEMSQDPNAPVGLRSRQGSQP